MKFRLTNRVKTHAPFQAYFTKSLNDLLSVRPTEGILEPYGWQGTEFTVSYSPKEFRIASGLLVIETENMMWTF